MPDPSTTRLGLYKSKSDGSELVSYTQDIGQNLDKIDAAVGFAACTSTTRPSSPYSGKAIMQTDTAYRTFFSNGTSPASASWVEIPNSSGTYGGNLALATGSTLSIGAATLSRSSGGAISANTNYSRSGSASTDVAYSALVAGDGFDRVRLYTSGMLEIGPGNAARDVNVYRSSANVLATDDSFSVGINLSVAGSASLTGALAVGSKAVLDATSGQFTTYANNTVTTYTPAVTGWGSTTFSTRTGWYVKVGKMVFVNIKLMTSAVGSGSSNCQIDLPSIPNTTQDTLLLMRWQENEIGYAICFSGGATATIDRLRVQDGSTAGQVKNLLGSMVGSGQNINIMGWYLEA